MLLLLAGCLLLVGCNKPGEADTAPRGVILLRYAPGSESTHQREQGFLDTLKSEFPQIHVLSSDQYSGTTPESSLDKAQQLIVKYGDRIQGFFAVCEPNASGALGALDEAGMAGDVKLIGFDPNERMVQALEEGRMHGIVLQDPVAMGYQAVKTLVAHLNGEQVERRISTGEYLATPENMHDPQMHKLLHPEQLSESPPAPANVKRRIAVIPKGTTHEFWKSVHFGAQQAADEAGGVEVLYKGPQLESDREMQISLVQDFITKQVDGIVLAPLDSQALISVVNEAKAAGIPVVIFDSGLDDESAYVSYVATDNYQGGVLAARRMAELLGAAPSSSGSGDAAASAAQ